MKIQDKQLEDDDVYISQTKFYVILKNFLVHKASTTPRKIKKMFMIRMKTSMHTMFQSLSETKCGRKKMVKQINECDEIYFQELREQNVEHHDLNLDSISPNMV